MYLLFFSITKYILFSSNENMYVYFDDYYCLLAKEFKSIFKAAFIVLWSFVFVGGAILSIFYLSNAGNVNSVNGVMMLNKLSSKYLVYGVFVSIFIVKIVFDVVDRHYYLKNKTVELCIINDDKQIRVTALLDTGNCLKDPISGCPIIIADAEYVSELLPKEIINILNDKEQVSQINDYEVHKRIRVIPYTTIGVQNGVLLGYRVDYIYVITKEKVGLIKNPIIALSKEHLSKKEDYQAIAYPEIINWEVK
ncbi:sigma-E processing peptidase SpoIIGA [Caloramator sp. mosi_1]|nr:sigma-E processing peptidase SpoIIGA [Caloramator sp. mosi_1]WDC84078.1 sigma-E processing peptidase SpoIIGA [Caloramator sp. mosi_1]